jgi:hypothetical protein
LVNISWKEARFSVEKTPAIPPTIPSLLISFSLNGNPSMKK